MEKLVEKGMEQHDKNWKDKFIIKHNAKKEILEIKNKHKIDKEEINKEKRNWFEKLQENKIKKREIEEQRKLEEQRRIEKEKRRKIRNKSILSAIIGIIALSLIIVGFSSENNVGMALGGMGLVWVLMFMWFNNDDEKKSK